MTRGGREDAWRESRWIEVSEMGRVLDGEERRTGYGGAGQGLIVLDGGLATIATAPGMGRLRTRLGIGVESRRWRGESTVNSTQTRGTE